MKWRVWLWLSLTLLPVAAIIAVVARTSAPSVVIITNEGSHPATLSVRTVNAGQFSWDGQIAPGDRVIRFARFSDNSFRITCRDASAEGSHAGGYVTNGLSQVVDVQVRGCANVSTTIEILP